ncbi:MAG: hypothetical protein ACJA0S_000569 [Rickettsiales bacterium]|jgi:hypothetical protein
MAVSKILADKQVTNHKDIIGGTGFENIIHNIASLLRYKIGRTVREKTLVHQKKCIFYYQYYKNLLGGN